jgi:PAS domain-containing protein
MEVKITSQFFTLLQTSVQYQRVQRYLISLELRRSFATVVAFIQTRIAELKPSISTFREAAAVIGQRAQQTLVEAKIAVGYKARRVAAAFHARNYYLPELRTGCAAALLAANSGIKQIGSRLSVPLERCVRYVQSARQKVTSRGKDLADKPRRARVARHTREKELKNLLAMSVDAIVVTDDQHRCVAANAKALELFGVSAANIRNFTLDTFISKDQISGLNGHGASFYIGEVKKGHCKIRCLNGNLRLADYEFTANHLPFRHLCIFRNVVCQSMRPTGRCRPADCA